MNSSFLRTVSIATATVLLVGCGGISYSDEENNDQLTTQSKGTAPANKGPFAKGSTVTAYKLNSDGSRSSETNSTKTTDDKGTFTISVPWEGPTELNIVGSYLNETTGSYMNDGDLSAIVDMKADGNNSLGINIFTHMAVSVIRKKMADNAGADFETLKEESKEVIANQFNLKLDGDTALEDLDMTSTDEDANVQLLQISAALMNTPNPAKTLANISEDISDGEVDDEGQAALEELDEEMEKVDIVAVAQNIENNVENSVVPTELSILNGTLAWDSNISFPSVNDVARNTAQTSSLVTINGVIGDSAALTIANGAYKLNGAVENSTATTVRNGDKLELVGTSATTYNTESSVTVTIGGEAIPFVLRTKADPTANDDAVPNEFDFGFKKNVAPSSSVSSAEVVVSGINKATPISIDNGTFTVNGSSASEVNNGDKVVVSLTSGALGESKKATVTIGGVEGKFIVTSEAKDSMPVINGSFQSVAGVEKATAVVSNEVEITAINTAIPVSIEGAELSINGAAFVTSGTVSTGDKVKVKVTSADAFDTAKEVSLNVGVVVVPFTTQTKSDPVVPDKTPNAFSFNAQTTSVANTPMESESITVSSINEAVAISVKDGKYSINGGDFISTASTVNEGDKVVVQLNSADYGSNEKAILTIGGVSATFNVTTIKDDVLDSISFTSKSAIARGVVIESDAVTVSGVNVAIPVSVVGGEYSINGGEYVSTAGTVNNGDSLKVRVTSANMALTSTSAVLSVGDLQLPFIVETQASIAPVSVVDAITTAEDTMVTIDVLGNDSDADGDNLTIVNLSTPTSGTVAVVNGKVNYTPNSNFVGTDTFTYRANDGVVNGGEVRVTVTVTAVNDAPVVEDKTVTVAEDTEQVITLTATDVDGETSSFNIVNQPTHGAVTLDGALATYVPNKDYVGTDSFTYSASDDSETSNVATVNITVTDVGDAPVAIADTITTDKFTEITIDVLDNDSDIDEDALTISSVVSPNSGTATIVNNKILYVPSGDFTGTVTFSYVVSDGTLTDTADVTIEITNVQSKLITALNILDATNFETDDVTAKLDEVKTTLNSADALDKDAQVGKALFALAEITNSEEVGELIDVTLDGSSVDVSEYLPSIVEGLSRDSIETEMVESISDMSATSTTVLHNVVIKLEEIERTLDESFSDEDYLFSYNDMNVTNNQSKMLRAAILAAASKLEYMAAFNYLSSEDVQPRTTTLNGVTVEYTTIDSNPVSVFNRDEVGSLTSMARLSHAKSLLLDSLSLFEMVDATKEDSEDQADIADAKTKAGKLKASLNGTAPYIIENDGEERVEKIYLDLSALYNESKVWDMAHTVGHNFSYESESYYDNQEYTAGAYNQAISQQYNDAMAAIWIDEDGRAITYVEGQMERPTMDIRPTIPTGESSHIPLVVTKVELIESEATRTYEGDDVLRYFFNDIDVDSENNHYHYNRSEDINITYSIDSESMIAVADEPSYEFELLYAPSWLHLTRVDVDRARLTADAGEFEQACYAVRVTDTFGHSEERSDCLYVETPHVRFDFSENNINLNQGDSRTVTLITENVEQPRIVGEAPDFITLNGNEISITPSSDTEVNSYEVQLEANSTVSDEVIRQSLQVFVNPEGSNHAPTMSLSPDYIRLNTANSETTSVEIYANDEDGDSLSYKVECYTCGTVEDQAPSFVTLDTNIINITPNSGDEGSYDIQVSVSDENGGFASHNLHIEVVSEAPSVHTEIDFSQKVASGSYEGNATVDPTSLAGTTMYSLHFSSHDSNNELEVEKFFINTNTIDISELNDDTTWSTSENIPYTVDNGEFLIDEDGDGADFKIKYVGNVDFATINSMANRDIFSTGTEAYHFIYKQLVDKIKFYSDDEYVHSHGNTENEYYTSLSEFIAHQQGGHWFMEKDGHEGGIAFATDSTGNSGTLIEVNGNGETVNANAGTWEINEEGVLVVAPNISLGYYASAFKVVSDANGADVLLRGDYQRVGDEEEFLWFNETGKNQFLQFLQSQQSAE